MIQQWQHPLCTVVHKPNAPCDNQALHDRARLPSARTMASATRRNDISLKQLPATGETRDAGASTSTHSPIQRLSATMAPLSTRQTPEDTVCETPQANHKVFSPQRRREPKEARDLESGLWHATGVSEDSEQQEQAFGLLIALIYHDCLSLAVP
ncbi:hypothetical protein DL546_006377 [Coniochaeta pulveracea]|uniref:Uncharacterized protein n=1 Tax=Coniochaeta pulveracea TaxID=177199 RepID=A0A420YA62_9PEZI|nr:hypothetical protein DL546_006377 [Coniochaeta pulveracea]